MGNYKFICKGCGTNYSSSSTTPPPGINWTDGHKCNPVLITNTPVYDTE